MRRMVSSWSVAFICTILGLSSVPISQSWTTPPSLLVSRMPATSTRVRPSTQLSMSLVPVLDEWRLLKNGGVSGIVSDHPSDDIDDGDTIETSPLSNPEGATRMKVVTTVTGSKYRLANPKGMKDMMNGKRAPPQKKKQSKEEIDALRKMAKAYDLNGKRIGPYVLSGSPQRSTSGKSQIWTAYRTDTRGMPVGEPLAIKTSTNKLKLEGEYENYRRVASGVFQGCFVNMIQFLPIAGDTSPFVTQAGLVVEKGQENLKDYFKGKTGGLKGRALRDAAAAGAECIQAIHSSRLVWTDMKVENFVLMNDKSASGGGIQIKGIDLESCCPVRQNPVDYSPESSPPEFARDLLKGEGPYFVLDYSYDIWSYGIMLYEISTGKSPYGTRKSASQISKILSTDGFEVDVSDVPDPKLRDLVKQCLQTNPKRRPSIAQILLHPYFLTTGIGPFSF